MKQIRRLIFSAIFIFITVVAHAGSPVWTFATVPGFPPQVNLSSQATATIKYEISNQSRKTHRLKMKPILGIATTGCEAALEFHQSCTLNLTVSGSSLSGDVIGGPIVCQDGNAAQCYQPSSENGLRIHLTSISPAQQYTVTPTAGANGIISPSTIQVVNAGDTLMFIAVPDVGYAVNQWFVDGNLVQTGGISYSLNNITNNQTVNVTFDTVTLTPSVSELGLSVNCQPASGCGTTQNAALIGNARQITIANTGTLSATNVSVGFSGLPLGSLISGNTCSGTLNGGDTCTITLTPGSVASSDLSSNPCTSGTAPSAGTVTISADGGLSTVVNIYVLSYGCIYQGGYLFAVDDSTPNSGSIGGKVVSLIDQVNPNTGIIWSANNIGGYDGGISIWAIDQASTSVSPSPNNAGPVWPATQYVGQNNCDGNIDGSCDTNNIYVYYHSFSAGAPIATNFYAAGQCKASISSYSDWYLPAICEMGPNINFAGCNASMQNIFNNFPALISDIGNSASCALGANCLEGYYWSTTELLTNSKGQAWVEFFDLSFNDQTAALKNNPVGVRCVRALTP